MFTVIPSIDLLGGRPVRLFQGDPNRATFYDEDPIVRARRFQEAGAQRFHLVNLDGAFGTEAAQENFQIIRRVVSALNIPVQVGGGFRSADQIQEAAEVGIQYIILGTASLEPDLDILRLLRCSLADRLVADIGFDGKEVKVKGWQEDTGLSVGQAVRQIVDSGFQRLVLTNKQRDGALVGPDLSKLNAVAMAYPKLRVIASGGVGTLEHIKALCQLALDNENIEGVILGKRLWEPDGFDFFTQALQLCSS